MPNVTVVLPIDQKRFNINGEEWLATVTKLPKQGAIWHEPNSLAQDLNKRFPHVNQSVNVIGSHHAKRKRGFVLDALTVGIEL